MELQELLGEGIVGTLIAYLIFKDKITEMFASKKKDKNEIGTKTKMMIAMGHNPNLETLDSKLDDIKTEVAYIGKGITKLTTIIDERLPSKFDGR